jgi:hypothetical protein
MIEDPFTLGLSKAVLTEDGLVERTGEARTLPMPATTHVARQPGEDEAELAPRSSQVAFWTPGPIGRRW